MEENFAELIQKMVRHAVDKEIKGLKQSHEELKRTKTKIRTFINRTRRI